MKRPKPPARASESPKSLCPHWPGPGPAAEEERADPAACVAALDKLIRHLDNVGEPVATELRHRWARAWHRETGRCPTCGDPGPLHGDQ